jgi:hypothetical protein
LPKLRPDLQPNPTTPPGPQYQSFSALAYPLTPSA